MSAVTEQEIIDDVYSLYETDTSNWAETEEEYLAARKWANVAIRRWANYDNTTWRELFATLTASTEESLVKTLTAGTSTYTAPADFRRIASWVRVLDGSNVVDFWKVIGNEKSAKYANSTAKVCWFTGNIKDGHVLNFNPKVTLVTDRTINYEYYKVASIFSATDSTTEMSDPDFIVYFILARFLRNDGEDNMEELQEADDRLETMRTANMSGFGDVPDDLEEALPAGFGK